MEEKRCSRCKQTKPLSEFYKNRSTPSGLTYECKTCKKELISAHRRENNIPIGHPTGINSGRGKMRFLARTIKKNTAEDTCITLHIHSEIMKDAPEHLTTEFMQKMLGRKC